MASETTSTKAGARTAASEEVAIDTSQMDISPTSASKPGPAVRVKGVAQSTPPVALVFIGVLMFALAAVTACAITLGVTGSTSAAADDLIAREGGRLPK